MVIYKDKKSAFNIVIKESPSADERAAATELQYHLKKIGGVEIAIGSDGQPSTTHEIILGRNSRLAELDLDEDWGQLGKEGYIIRTVGSKLVIAGNTERGTLNGVYAFLEDVVGVRWLTPEVTYFPKRAQLPLKDVSIKYNPPFAFRQMINVNTTGRLGGKWAARNRVNNAYHIQPHTLFSVFCQGISGDDAQLQLEDVFSEHPEYFSEIRGKRTWKYAQLCFSNPDIEGILTEGLIRQIEDEDDILNLSSMDGGRPCQCSTCRKQYEELGNASSVFFGLLNRIAGNIEKQHPGVTIDTLAYHFTQRPPTGIVLKKNIRVMYAPIRSNSYEAFDEGDHNTKGGLINIHPPSMGGVVGQIEEWVSISDDVIVWLTHLRLPMFCPHPDLRGLTRNLPLIKRLGAKGVFVEELNWVKEHQLNHLRAYLLAKLMWNPDYNAEKGIEEFCRLYYGPAYQEALEYLELLHSKDSWDWEEGPFWDYRRPTGAWGWFGESPGPLYYKKRYLYISWQRSPPLKVSFFEEAGEIFDEAFEKVRGSKIHEERLRVLQLPSQYAALAQLPKESDFFQDAYKNSLPLIKKIIYGQPSTAKRWGEWFEGFKNEIDDKMFAEEKAAALANKAAGVDISTLGGTLQFDFEEEIPGSSSMVADRAGEVENNGERLSRGSPWKPEHRVPGRDGYAYAFGGNEGKRFIRVPSAEEPNLGTGDFSISFWIKTAQEDHSVGIIVRATSPPYWLVGMAGGRLIFHIKDAVSDATQAGGSSIINDEAWHHVVVMADRDGSGTIHIDAQQNASFPINGNQGSLESDVPISIGSGWTNYFDGVLDSVCLYNRLLTPAEILAVYRKEGAEILSEESDGD